MVLIKYLDFDLRMDTYMELTLKRKQRCLDERNHQPLAPLSAEAPRAPPPERTREEEPRGGRGRHRPLHAGREAGTEGRAGAPPGPQRRGWR